MPPALQEEVLTQQRLEQQRQAAARAPPNEPVDAHAFFQTLQPSLRTMVSTTNFTMFFTKFMDLSKSVKTVFNWLKNYLLPTTYLLTTYFSTGSLSLVYM